MPSIHARPEERLLLSFRSRRSRPVTLAKAGVASLTLDRQFSHRVLRRPSEPSERHTLDWVRLQLEVLVP